MLRRTVISAFLYGPLAKVSKSVEQIVDAQLTETERANSVVYLLSGMVAAHTTLDFPHAAIKAPWEASLAFVDRDPMANWGHSCRYLLIGRSSGEVVSIEARFPPFRKDGRHWRVVYQAKSVPDSALAIPKE